MPGFVAEPTNTYPNSGSEAPPGQLAPPPKPGTWIRPLDPLEAAGGGVTRPGNVTPRAAAEDSTKAGKPARTDAEAYSEPAAEQPVEKHESSYQAAVAAMTVLLTTQPTARVAGAEENIVRNLSRMETEGLILRKQGKYFVA